MRERGPAAILDRLGRTLIAAPLAAAVGVLLAVALLRNGVGAYPFAGYFASEVAPVWPDVPPDVPALFQYVLWAPIGTASAHLLGIGSRAPFLVLHAVVLLAGLGLFLALVQRRLGGGATRAVLVVLAVAPVATVVLAWSGSYDTFTVVFALLLVVSTSSRWSALLGVLLAFSALEHGAIVIVLLGVLAVAGVWGEVRPLLAAAAGLVGGGMVLVVWLRAHDVVHGRAYWLQHFGLRYFLDMTRQGWPLLALSLFGAALPIAVVVVRNAPAGRRLLVAAVLLAPLVPTIVTEDQTRVFAVLTTPVLVAATLSLAARDLVRLHRPMALALVIGVLVPGFFVWKGSSHIADWGPWTALLRG